MGANSPIAEAIVGKSVGAISNRISNRSEVV